jgi:hypothetical protein
MEALTTRNKKMLMSCLEHGLEPNKVINEETGDSIIYYKYSYITCYC